MEEHYRIILGMTSSDLVKIITKIMDHHNVLGVLPTGGEINLLQCLD